MQTASPATAAARPAWLVLLAAGAIVAMAMGLRMVMGFYLIPVSDALGLGRAPFSNAIGVANLVWGLTAILAGAISDKFGSGRVVVVCALATVAGLLAMMFATSAEWLYVSGVLTGIGVAGTGVNALVGAVGRAVPPNQRVAAIASLGMASGIGQLVAFPLTHVLIEQIGWKLSLGVLGAIALTMIPLAWPVSGRPPALAANVKSQTLGEALREAAALPSYWLLTIGFFVCGFHLAFYGTHLPAFVRDQGLPDWVAVWAWMAVGIANILGTYVSGQSGRWVAKRVGLSFIYFMRIFPFLALLYLPITPLTVIAVSAFLGLFWLSTVPLTSTLVGMFFGTQWMSMLYGIVFLSHQLGSFTGLYLAGMTYDATRSYDLMWWISIALGLAAAAIHLPIRERPVPRMAAAEPAMA